MQRRVNKVQPIERFPAKPRRDGRFQKRIRRRLYYFGDGSGDRAKALAEYERVKHDLYAGRRPRVRVDDPGAATVRTLARKFLADKKGSIDPETFKQYRRALRRFVKRVGPDRVWIDLLPDDFTDYGKFLRGSVGPYAYNRERAAIVAMFNHADEQDWIERAPKYGKMFKRIPKRDLRGIRVLRLLARDEINALLGMSGPNLYAMILLALNGGLGAADCASLPVAKVHLDDGIIRNYARTKNNIPRTVPLWPETVQALRRVIRLHPHSRYVFRTRSGGPWRGTGIAHEFAKIADRANVKLPASVGLYAARHTFATYANEVRDTDARRHIMGRLLPNLDDIYVETLFEQRLKAVTDHVHRRLEIAQVVGFAVPISFAPAPRP